MLHGMMLHGMMLHGMMLHACGNCFRGQCVRCGHCSLKTQWRFTQQRSHWGRVLKYEHVLVCSQVALQVVHLTLQFQVDLDQNCSRSVLDLGAR